MREVSCGPRSALAAPRHQQHAQLRCQVGSAAAKASVPAATLAPTPPHPTTKHTHKHLGLDESNLDQAVQVVQGEGLLRIAAAAVAVCGRGAEQAAVWPVCRLCSICKPRRERHVCSQVRRRRCFDRHQLRAPRARAPGSACAAYLHHQLAPGARLLILYPQLHAGLVVQGLALHWHDARTWAAAGGSDGGRRRACSAAARIVPGLAAAGACYFDRTDA